MNYSALLSLSALLMIIGSACGSDDPPRSPTRVTAKLDGILAEENGCLRVIVPYSERSRALVWQKDIFKIERRGDAVLIVDLNPPNGRPSPTVIWRLGDMIRAGGGASGPEGADRHAGAGFSERCAGPYFMVSMLG